MTDEDPAIVQAWLTKAKPTYPIAIAGGAFETFIKVPHFPFSAVIGPDGNIAYAGDSGGGEGCIETGLTKSKKEPLWPKSLSKVSKLMTGDPVKAYGELKKLTEGGKVVPQDKPFVDGFVSFLEGQAQSSLTEARTLSEKGQVLKAVRKVEAYSLAQPQFPTSADSTTFLKELQALPDYKKEVAGGESYLAAEQLEKDSEYLDAFEGFKSVSKKFAGTKIADNARVQAERIKNDGLPGMEADCENCARAKRACDKHKKDVKL